VLAHSDHPALLRRAPIGAPTFLALLVATVASGIAPFLGRTTWTGLFTDAGHAIAIVGFALAAAAGAGLLAQSYLSMQRAVRAWADAEAAARTAALTDELTGLYNRRGFRALAEHQLRIARRTGADVLLLFLDLDGFKHVNDRLGHEAGDRALREVADLLRNTIRETDVIARLGGDEFAVLVVDATDETEDAVRARLTHATAARNAQPGRTHDLAYTLGRASLDENRAASLDDLLATADRAMYVAKPRGERRAVVAGR
jgi:diguanylate cyclase (GGDEF)-like protein